MNCVRLKARSLFRNAEHARNAYIVQIRGTCTPFVARSIYSDIKVIHERHAHHALVPAGGALPLAH
eukprot:scaffold9610_cov20-Tisochrysis_lutea.AAC.1